jgi:hypothetical protein
MLAAFTPSCFEQVYKERIHKRMPGMPTCTTQETPFAVLTDWVAAEAGGAAVGASTFTRVIVSDLKADILKQLRDEAARNVCRQLAHLYHYYLHGAEGNTQDGAQLPAILKLMFWWRGTCPSSFHICYICCLVYRVRRHPVALAAVALAKSALHSAEILPVTPVASVGYRSNWRRLPCYESHIRPLIAGSAA